MLLIPVPKRKIFQTPWVRKFLFGTVALFVSAILYHSYKMGTDPEYRAQVEQEGRERERYNQALQQARKRDAQTTAVAASIKNMPLKAEVSCGPLTGVVVKNGDVEAWNNVRIKVNASGLLSSGWSFDNVASLAPGETLNLPASAFTKSDGEMLDLMRYACKSVDIHADTSSGRRHGNFGYR